MGLRRNLLAGWTGSAISAVIGLLVVPAFVRYLGSEAYGLIGFYVTLLNLLQVLDFGLGATVTREVARSSTDEERSAVATLVAALASGVDLAIALRR